MSAMLLTIVISVLALLTVGGVGYSLVGADPHAARARQRLQSVKRGTTVTSRESKQQQKEQDRRKTVQKALHELEEKQKQGKKLPLDTRIEQAGLEFGVLTFWLASLGFGVFVFLAMLMGGLNPLVAAGGGLAAGFGFPRWVIAFLTAKRQKVFMEEFANALDVIVRGVKAGLPLTECLNIVARESPDPVGSEFRSIVEGSRMGITLEEGLQRMYERMPVPEVNFFVIVLSIQSKTGGNLSEALGNLTTVLRDRKSMRGKIQAMSSEAKASAGIIGSLPPGVAALIFVSTPDYIRPLFTEQMGNLLILGGAIWMTIGVLVMKKMINFNF